MVNAVIEAIVFAVALCGALGLTYALALLFVSRGETREYLILLRCSDQNCARQLYAAQLRFSFFCFPNPCRVLGIDCGISEEEKKTCRALCRQCSGIELLTPEELKEMITKEEQTHDPERS